MDLILKGTKIWCGDENAKDVYADFNGQFTAEKGGEKIYLRVSCDSNYTVWVNGNLAGFAACADYPERRNYDKIDITEYCGAKNDVKITVWHYGEDSQTYIAAPAFLLFDIIQGENVLLKSDKRISSRINANYKNGYLKGITTQLGLSFLYDANAKENVYGESRELGDGKAYIRRRKTCRLKPRIKTRVTKAGGGYLVDTGKEVVGFVDLEIESERAQKLTISYAEHLTDGTVQSRIDGRDFSVEYVAAAGKNSYMNTFRRVAGRYLLIECKSPITVVYAGIRPVEYPLVEIKRTFSDKSLQKIYDVGVYTLKCCMHEHYEDCPWREQALYTLDSRNQMLCGYYAFKGNTYQKENLLLISNGLRKDGLLSLCFPAGKDFPIPFFSLVYVMQVWEYIEHTGDRSVLKKILPVLETIMNTFKSRIEENGLIADFEYPYWNFYEWTDGSHNDWQITRAATDVCEKQYDLILNCFYIIACGYYEKITGVKTATDKTAESIKKTFYNADKKSFKLSTFGEEKYSQLGNSMAILAGVADGSVAEATVSDESLIRVSLSMNAFYYDALLKTDEKYKKFVLEDIRAKYGRMLSEGATTFWETELGWRDFGNAGSMCHGWSALPVYYLNFLV